MLMLLPWMLNRHHRNCKGKTKPKKKTTGSQEEIQSILNTTNMTFLDYLSVKYQPNAPTIKPVERKIRRLDDNYCLVAESGVNIYKYDVRSKAVFLGDERNETIQHPAENRIQELLTIQNNWRQRSRSAVYPGLIE